MRTALVARGAPARRLVVRSAPDSKAPVAVADLSADKVKRTLSSLDALLGADASQEATTSAPAATASTSPAAPPSTSYQPTTSAPSGAAQTQQSWQQAPGPSSSKKAERSFNFDQVMGFDGLAPEIINGRAAMLGFIAAIMGEISTGDSMFSQLVAGGGAKALAVIGVVLVASFAPALRQMPFDEMFGKDKHPLIFGPFNPNAEVRNGRAAMLGLAALFFIEGTSNQAFFF